MNTKKNVTLSLILCLLLVNIFGVNLFIDSVNAAGTVSESVYDSQQTEKIPIKSNCIGDVNGDGNINSLDFAYMRMFLLDSKNSFPVSNGMQVADTDGNGIFNSIDFAYMRQFLLGIIKIFPAEDLIMSEPNCFDYALFSGDKENRLTMYGEGFNIFGNIHSNSNITVYAGPKAKINGTCEAVKNVEIFGVSTDYIEWDHASILSMPNLSNYFCVRSKYSNTYISASYNPLTGKKFYQDLIEEPYGEFKNNSFSEGCTLECSYYDESNPTWIVCGDKLVLNDDMPIFFDGSVILNVDQISGNGFIVATKNIKLNLTNKADFGLKYKEAGNVDLENSSEIGLYSINGDIYLIHQGKLN